MVAIRSPRHALLHTPVLTDEVVKYLAVEPGGRYLDCTVGAGGHARAILQAGEPGALVVGLDADPEALLAARENLAGHQDSVRLVHANFRELRRVARALTFVPVHGVLFDLGVSSMQLSESGRGFSFQSESPLDMRFNPQDELTASNVVNEWPEADLARIIWELGEDRMSRRIASAIVGARPIRTTMQLADVVARAAPRGRSRIHPATRTFQALRMAVNDELATLEDALEQAVDVLGSGGRLVVISFHSLEDRLVKQFLQRESRDCICPPGAWSCTCGHKATLKVLTKRPIIPDAAEVRQNPRSRSAKLRAAEKNGVSRDVR